MDADGADNVLMGDRKRRQGNQRNRDLIDGVSIIVREDGLFVAEYLTAELGRTITFPCQCGELDPELAGQERTKRFDDHAAALRS